MTQNVTLLILVGKLVTSLKAELLILWKYLQTRKVVAMMGAFVVKYLLLDSSKFQYRDILEKLTRSNHDFESEICAIGNICMRESTLRFLFFFFDSPSVNLLIN